MMFNLNVQRVNINVEALDAALRAAFGGTFFGLSFNGEEVILHFDDKVSSDNLSLAEQMVEAHDPSKLTPQQEAESAQAQQLEGMRTNNETPLNLSAYQAAKPEIVGLAEKIAWLEQEILALRKGEV